ETVEGWANSAGDSASAAGQSEAKAKEYRDAACSAASSTADELRGDLSSIASEASRSASRAKTSETNAATHEANSLSAAERAEFAAEETIQQVEGDFATRNYVDNQAGAKFVGYAGSGNSLLRTDENGKIVVSTESISGDLDVVNKRYVDSASFARGTLTASHNLDAMADKKYAGAWQVTSTPVAESLGVPSPGFGTLIVFWAAGLSEPYYTATQWWVPAASGDMYKRSIISRGS